MAHVIIFPDQVSFEKGLNLLQEERVPAEPLDPPVFCRGLVASSVVVTGAERRFAVELERRGVSVCGESPFFRFNREVPEGAPPDPIWHDISGGLRLHSVRRSVTDSSKLRVEIALGRSIAALIPIMARLIRGGTFVPSVPTLVFEEEHRLVAMAPEEIVISRTDDLLDMWVMVRTSVELMRTAWEHRGKIGPEREPRQGIGAVELFKRLPGINCRQCRCDGCMEFATGLLTARTNITDCTPLQEPSSQCLQRSVRWLLGVTGLAVAR